MAEIARRERAQRGGVLGRHLHHAPLVERYHLERHRRAHGFMVLHGVRGGGRRLEELRLGVRLLDAVHRLRARLAGAGAVLVERATNHGERRPREDAARGDASRERSRRRGFLQAFLLLGEEFRRLLWIFAGVDFRVDTRRRRGRDASAARARGRFVSPRRAEG